MSSRRLPESPVSAWTTLQASSSSDQDGDEEEEEITEQKKRKLTVHSSSSLHSRNVAKKRKLDDGGRGDISAGPSNVRRALNNGPSPLIRPGTTSRNAVDSSSKPSSSTMMSSQRGNVSSVNTVSHSSDTDSASASMPRFVPKQVARKTTGSKSRIKPHISATQGRGNSEASSASSSKFEDSRAPSRTKLVKRTKEEKERRRKSGLSSDEEEQLSATGKAIKLGDAEDQNKGRSLKTTRVKDGPRRPSTSILAPSSKSAPAGLNNNNRRRSSPGDDDFVVLSSDNDATITGGRIANKPKHKPKVARKPVITPESIIVISSDDDTPPQSLPKKDKEKRRDSQANASASTGPKEVIEILDSDEGPPPERKQSKGKEKETVFQNAADDGSGWDLDANVGMNDDSIPPSSSSSPARMSSAPTSRPRAASLDKDYEMPRIKEEGKKEKSKPDSAGMENESREMSSSAGGRVRPERLSDIDISDDNSAFKVKKTKKIRAPDADSASASKRNSVSLPPPRSSASASSLGPTIPQATSRPSTAAPTPLSPSSNVADALPSPPQDPDLSASHEPDTHESDASESYGSQIAAFGEQMAEAFKTSGHANAQKRDSTDDTKSALGDSPRRSARKRPSNARFMINAKGEDSGASSSSDSEDVDMGELHIPASGFSQSKTNAAVGNARGSDTDRADGENPGVRIPPPVKSSSTSRTAASLNPLTSLRFEGKRRSSYSNSLASSTPTPLPRSGRQSETPSRPSLLPSASESGYSPALYPRVDLRNILSGMGKDRRQSTGQVRNHTEVDLPVSSLPGSSMAADGESASRARKPQAKGETEAPIRIPKPLPRKSAVRVDQSDVASAIEAASRHNDDITVKATGRDDDPIDLTSLTDNDDEPMAHADAAAQAVKQFFSFDSSIQDENEQDQALALGDGDVPMTDARSRSREATDELNICSPSEDPMDQDVKVETSSPQRPLAGNKQSSSKQENRLPLFTPQTSPVKGSPSKQENLLPLFTPQTSPVKESPSKQEGRSLSTLFTPRKSPRQSKLVADELANSSSLEEQVDDLSQEMSALPLEELSKPSNEDDSTAKVAEELFPELEYVDVPARDDHNNVSSEPNQSRPRVINDGGLVGSKYDEPSSGSDSEKVVVQTLTARDSHGMDEDSPQDDNGPSVIPIVTHEPELQVPITEEELTGRSTRSRSNSSPPLSPPIALRRRARRVRSSTRNTEGDYDSSGSSFVTPPRSPSPDEHPSTPLRSFGGAEVLTWEQYRRELRYITPDYYLAKDLPHKMHDYINAMEPFTREYPQMQLLFETMILENTAEDEPDAPPISVRNEVDDEAPTPLWEFYYTNRMWLGKGVPPPSRKKLISCNCVGKCDPKSKKCACLKRQQKATGDYQRGFLYDSQGLLKQGGLPIYECNSLCGCGEECKNRVVGNGRKVQVQIQKTLQKGWGVFAGSKRIPKGSFIGIYAGELIIDEEAEKRGEMYNKFGRTYLFDVDFYHIKQVLKRDPEASSRYCVDAYHAGNFTRFLNHSCDPNCSLTPVYIDDDDIEKPLLVIFAKKDINAYDELTFSYRGDFDDDDGEEEQDVRHAPPSSPSASKTLQSKGAHAVYASCRCGARNCKGEIFLRG